MEEKTQKKLFIAVIAILVIVVGFLIWQQFAIIALKKTVSPSAIDISNEGADRLSLDAKPKLPDYLVEAAKNDLISDTKEIIGTVLEVKNNLLSVEAEIVNLEKIADAESTDIVVLPKVKKIFSVTANEKTEFLSVKLGDVKPDGQIQVFSDDLIYKTDKITATKINYPYAAKADSGQKFVGGKVKEIKNNILTLAAMSADGKETGTYSVKIGKDTKFIKKEFSAVVSENKEFAPQPPKITEIGVDEIKIGDVVVVLSNDPIGEKKEFEAIEIDKIISQQPTK